MEDRQTHSFEQEMIVNAADANPPLLCWGTLYVWAHLSDKYEILRGTFYKYLTGGSKHLSALGPVRTFFSLLSPSASKRDKMTERKEIGMFIKEEQEETKYDSSSTGLNLPAELCQLLSTR